MAEYIKGEMMGNRCNICEWWDAPGKRETGYCLNQKPGQRVTKKDFCCPRFSEGLWQDRWKPESIARRAKQESNESNLGGKQNGFEPKGE